MRALPHKYGFVQFLSLIRFGFCNSFFLCKSFARWHALVVFSNLKETIIPSHPLGFRRVSAAYVPHPVIVLLTFNLLASVSTHAN
jgi:hypothetical protein